tara:strand:- start:30 stop:635 length:606 start_codon:yes stop_codon:yes gene_type:complete
MSNSLKKCRQCKLKRPVSEFSKEKRTYYIKNTNKAVTYSYYGSYCNACIKIRLKKLSARKRDKKVHRDDGSIGWSGVLRSLRKRGKEKKIKCDINIIEFNRWIKRQTHKCTYCGFGIEESKKILSHFFKTGHVLKSKRLQIDRKSNDRSIGYTLKNICLACAICNSHRGDFYSHEEFKEIAKKYIVPKMEYILNKSSPLKL